MFVIEFAVCDVSAWRKEAATGLAPASEDGSGGMAQGSRTRPALQEGKSGVSGFARVY